MRSTDPIKLEVWERFNRGASLAQIEQAMGITIHVADLARLLEKLYVGDFSYESH
jgi:hypothetical protein